ncbi:hypothetical protein V2A60_004111 [Cordyceps javanica]
MSGPPARGALVVRQDNRKPLFGHARQTSTAPPPDTRIPALSRSKSSPGTQDKVDPSPPATTPGGSRIPRFGSGAFGSRKPMSLAEAFKRAGEEVDSSARPGPIDGSPSPAPRSWRMRPDDPKMRKTLNEDPLDSKRAVSPNKERIAMRNRVDDGIGKSRTSLWVLEEGMRDADAPLPSTENVAPGQGPSPEKSYAWQVDEDFTAGDLQVSDSPRIRVNKPPFAKLARSESPRKGTTPNTKLEEIRVRELGLTPNVASPRESTKLDDIRLREKEVEKQVPLLERGFPRIGGGLTKLDEIKQREMQGLSKRAIAQAKLEEIKERNAMTRSVSPDSPRRNRIGREAAGISRPKSAFEPAGRQVPDTPVTIYKSQAERIADDVRRAAAKKAQEKYKEAETRTTVANRGANGLSPQKRDQSRDLLRKLARAASASPAAPEQKPDDVPRTTNAHVPNSKPEAPRASSLKRSALLDSRRRPSNTSSNASKSASSFDRPTVGFAGLARSRSSDSRKSKRSSMHSEQDPTDRIEAEERLFAPMDNYSEHGSVRAPSPWVDEEERVDHEATPKAASKPDVLSMPTPRAPGAFVDTPITIKKEDRDQERPGRRRMSLEQSPDIKPDTALRAGKTDLARRSKDVDTASDPGAAEEKPVRPARSRSLPRRRPLTNSAKLPSVRDDLHELQGLLNINDTTLDNLEDILLGKKRTNEKLDELLQEVPAAADVVAEIKGESRSGTGTLVDDQKNEPKHNEGVAVDIENGAKRTVDVDVKTDLDDELAAYEALTASVERDLGVHNVGKIKVEVPPSKTSQRTDQKHLKKQLADTKQKDDKHSTTQTQTQTKTAPTMDEKHHHHPDDGADGTDCPRCVAASATPAVAYLPLPQLFHLTPRPRLTRLGVLLCAVLLWLAAESAMFSLYRRPATCSGEQPCVWSFDDPASFGTALPIKLDQWVTGGRGRAAWAALGDDLADLLDTITAATAPVVTTTAADGQEDMTPAQRRRYRNRLARKKKTRSKALSEEQKIKTEAWRKEREANERARRRGYVDEASVGGDERVW